MKHSNFETFQTQLAYQKWIFFLKASCTSSKKTIDAPKENNDISENLGNLYFCEWHMRKQLVILLLIKRR